MQFYSRAADLSQAAKPGPPNPDNKLKIEFRGSVNFCCIASHFSSLSLCQLLTKWFSMGKGKSEWFNISIRMMARSWTSYGNNESIKLFYNPHKMITISILLFHAHICILDTPTDLLFHIFWQLNRSKVDQKPHFLSRAKRQASFFWLKVRIPFCSYLISWVDMISVWLPNYLQSEGVVKTW